MNENDGFDEIVNGSEDGNQAATVEFDSMMEAVEYFWRQFNPGHIFVKGMIVVESVAPEGRGNTLESSSPITDADILGMLRWGEAKIVGDINAQSWVEAMAMIEDDDDAEDDLEDD